MTTKYDLIIPAVRDIISQYGGTRLTLRQIFYRLVVAQVIPNTQSQYKSLSAILVKARMNRAIGFWDIEDRTRGMDYGHGEDRSTADYFGSYYRTIRDLAGYYTLPVRWGQPEYVQVWVEKQALSRVFSDITQAEGIDLAVCKGYPSLTFLGEAAQDLRRHHGEGNRSWENVHVLYFGDYDPSGLDIERYIEERLGDLGAYPQVRRIAIDREQVDEYNIPPAPAKTSDSRYWTMEMETGEAMQVELDAIEPNTLQELIRAAIREHFEEEAGERREEVLERRQERIQEWVDEIMPEDYTPPEDEDEDEEFA